MTNAETKGGTTSTVSALVLRRDQFRFSDAIAARSIARINFPSIWENSRTSHVMTRRNLTADDRGSKDSYEKQDHASRETFVLIIQDEPEARKKRTSIRKNPFGRRVSRGKKIFLVFSSHPRLRPVRGKSGSRCEGGHSKFTRERRRRE